MTTQTNSELSKIFIRPNGDFITAKEAENFLVFPESSTGGLPTIRVSLFSKIKTWASYFFNSKNFVW